jgi:hypothetical protein
MINNWLQYLRNPYGIATKKHLLGILQDRYTTHEKFIDRLTTVLATQEDIESFSKLIVDLYELGFLRATEQYREQLSEKGYQLNIVKPKPSAQPIFPQSEKSG